MKVIKNIVLSKWARLLVFAIAATIVYVLSKDSVYTGIVIGAGIYDLLINMGSCGNKCCKQKCCKTDCDNEMQCCKTEHTLLKS